MAAHSLWRSYLDFSNPITEAASFTRAVLTGDLNIFNLISHQDSENVELIKGYEIYQREQKRYE